MIPTRMSTPKILHPTQYAKAASSVAGMMRIASTTTHAIPEPTSHATRAPRANAAPIAWANRFGAPGTGLAQRPRRGATKRVATNPSGLRHGPVSVRATNPYAIGMVSHS
jgi:hypothetical protein